MNKNEIGNLIKRIGTMRNSYMTEQAALEWAKILAPMDYQKANDLVSYYIQNTDECPTIAEFIREYDRYGKQTTKYIEDKKETETKCWVCMDKGYLFYYEEHNGNRYEYVAYCDHCPEGQKNKYDGSALPEHLKNKYWTPPISKIFDPDIIERKNREKYQDQAPVNQKMVEKARKELSNSLGAKYYTANQIV